MNSKQPSSYSSMKQKYNNSFDFPTNEYGIVFSSLPDTPKRTHEYLV